MASFVHFQSEIKTPYFAVQYDIQFSREGGGGQWLKCWHHGCWVGTVLQKCGRYSVKKYHSLLRTSQKVFNIVSRTAHIFKLKNILFVFCSKGNIHS